jgi:hypothetical protein
MDQLLPNSLNLIADPWKRGLGDDIILISFHYHSLPLALKARENDADEEEKITNLAGQRTDTEKPTDGPQVIFSTRRTRLQPPTDLSSFQEVAGSLCAVNLIMGSCCPSMASRPTVS